MEELISVLVAVYNVDKYITKCLDSIINQTYSNIEIVIVDDGSTDNSKKICTEYAKKDKRIKVFEIEHGGLSKVRNYGIKVAAGKYIYFVDSDDYLDNDLLETLYNNIKKENADISCCSFYEVFKSKIIKKNSVNEYFVMSSHDAILKSFQDEGLSVYAWNKLFKKELFNDIEFPLGKKSQDRFVMYQIFDKCQKIVYQSICKYYYVQRKDNTSMTLSKINTDSIEASLNAINYLKKYPQIINYATANYLLSELKCYKKKVLYSKKIDKTSRKKILNDLKMYPNSIMSGKNKIEFLLLKYFPHIYKIVCYIYYSKKYRNMI